MSDDLAPADYVRHLHQFASDAEDFVRWADDHRLPPMMVELALRMEAVLIGEAVTQLEARHPEFADELQRRVPEVNWQGWKRQRGPAAHNLGTFDHGRLVRALTAAVPLLGHGLEREFGEHLADREGPDPERSLAERAARHFGLPEGQQPTAYQLNTFRWAESVAAPGVLDAQPDPDLPARAAEHYGLAPGDQPTEYQLRAYAWREAVARRRRPPRGSFPRRRPGRGWGREAGGQG